MPQVEKVYYTARDVVARGTVGSKSSWRRNGPPPDGYMGEVAVWRLSTIERWEADQLARPPEARKLPRNLPKEPRRDTGETAAELMESFLERCG